MKKLLSILAAVGLTATASSTVVACGTDKKEGNKVFNNLELKYQDQVVMNINGQDITIADIFGNKDTAYDSEITSFINEKVAKEYTNDYYGKQLNPYVNLASENAGNFDTNDKTNHYDKQVDDLFTSSASLDLFVKYLDSLYKNDPLDNDQLLLNPIIYNGKNLKHDVNNLDSEYSIWFKADGENYKRWTVSSELAGVDYEGIVEDAIPTIEQLTSDEKDFIIVDNMYKGSEDSKDASGMFTTIDGTYSLNGQAKDKTLGQPHTIDEEAIVGTPMNGQTAVGLRMQQYIYANNSQNMNNVMVMQYLKSKAYTAKKGAIDASIDELSSQTDKALYLNLSSSFAKGVQTWKESSDTQPDIKSNYKLVWKFTTDGTDAKRDEINKAINDLVKDKTLDGYSRFDKTEQIKNVLEKIGATTSAETFDGETSDTTNNKDIKDPFFGASGFQGIVKDGASVSGGVLDIANEDAKNRIANVEGFGVISSGQNVSDINRVYNFTSSDSSKDDYVFVMPLYLLDLLRTNKSEDTNKATTPTTPVKNHLTDIAVGNWVEVNPQGLWGWNSKDDMKIDDTAEGFKLEKNKDTNKWFMKFDKADTKVNLTIKGESVSVESESTTDEEDDYVYGYQGIYSKSPDGIKAEDAKLLANNGKRVKYQINLGKDSTIPDNYEKSWTDTSSLGNGTPVDAIAGLTSDKKEDIINTLLFQVAKNDTNAQESAKYELYPKYIDIDKVYYKATKDELNKYIKEDEDKVDEEDW